MRYQAGPNDLANKRGQVWGNKIHLGLQIIVKRLSHSCQFNHLKRKVVDILHVHLHNILTHRHFSGLEDFLSNFFRTASIIKLLAPLLIKAITHTDNTCDLSISNIVCHNLGQLRKMPSVPLSDAHCKRIDVFVQAVKQRNRIDDGLVLAIWIQLHPIAAEAVPQSQACLIKVQFLQVLDQSSKVHAATTQKFPHSCSMADAELDTQLLSQLWVVDTKGIFFF
mmetsp:Transcript_110421/g.219496  ORF Transcript_110421/g.219496 Transcript_110421/m.219496 type:complete len:223 (-) Transcript_110421:305-973(-)